MAEVVEPEPRHPGLRRARSKAWRIASPRIGRPSRPTNTRSDPDQLAMCSASTGKTCGGRATIRLPASVLGSASNDALVASSSTRFRRTITHSASRSTSSRRKPSTSPRRRPHQAARRTAARYLGVIASTRAATSAGDAMGRSLARSEPAPAIWIGAVRRALSRDRTRCPRCPASRCTTRCRHRQAVVARVPRRARPAVRIRPQAWPGALHPRARCRPARQDAADS
jgi:hypothetical protein